MDISKPPHRQWHIRVSSIAIAASILLPIIEGIVGVNGQLRDLIRAFELVEAVMLLVILSLIVPRYWKNYKETPGLARLLPSHVFRICIGVMLLVIAASAAVIDAIGHPFIWYVTPITLPGITITLTAMIDMLRWLPHRRVLAGAADVSHGIERFQQAVYDVERDIGDGA